MYTNDIMSLIVAEEPELSALALGKDVAFDLVDTLTSRNINQSAPKLVKIYMTIKSLMSSIEGVVIPEGPRLSAPELGKITIFHFLYTQAKYQASLVKICMTIDYWCNETRKTRDICP